MIKVNNGRGPCMYILYISVIAYHRHELIEYYMLIYLCKENVNREENYAECLEDIQMLCLTQLF
ncbi:hypothetical protein KP509_20G008100 [Ceratopteris richardii]|nr:hypothetical protein KP509_20G008100 [Ceratopteris richardii]